MYTVNPPPNQDVAFLHYWEPYAKQAAGKLGIPYTWILAQWAMETDFGAQPNMGINNPGNVGNLGNGWQNYTSPTNFVKAYVAAMQADFPKLQQIQYQAQLPPSRWRPIIYPQNDTPQDILNGPNRYDPSVTDYGKLVANFLPTVDKDLNLPYNATGQVGLTTQYGTSGNGNGIAQDLRGILDFFQNIQQHAVTDLVIVALVILAILILYRGVIVS